MFAKHEPPIGSRPGTLAIDPSWPAPVVRLVEYDADSLQERQVDDLDQLVPYARTEKTTWVDVQGLGDATVLRRIGEIFGLHRLALEEAVNVPQRAKADMYDDHLVIIARAPLDTIDLDQPVPQVCLIASEHYLISFQERYFGFFDAVRGRIRAGNRPIRSGGPGYLAYALIDALVDRYYPVAEGLALQVDDLEPMAVEDPSPELIARAHDLRRHIAVLRRVGRPQRESLYRLSHEEIPFVSAETRLYMRDAWDHTSQVMELLDSLREMTGDLMDTALATLGHRANEVMKVLTLMASIFIPLTFIAGIYGMNFENMPELNSPTGYPAVIGVMLVVATVMLVYFRRRGWLGARPRRPGERDG